MADVNAMTKINAANLKKLENGGRIDYLFTMDGRQALLLIGKGHDPKLMQAVSKAKHFSGTIEIKKGGLTNAGDLTVTGCSGRRSEFETYVKTFSKKKVVYV